MPRGTWILTPSCRGWRGGTEQSATKYNSILALTGPNHSPAPRLTAHPNSYFKIIHILNECAISFLPQLPTQASLPSTSLFGVCWPVGRWAVACAALVGAPVHHHSCCPTPSSTAEVWAAVAHTGFGHLDGPPLAPPGPLAGPLAPQEKAHHQVGWGWTGRHRPRTPPLPAASLTTLAVLWQGRPGAACGGPPGPLLSTTRHKLVVLQPLD